MNEQRQLLANHVTVTEYAKEKGISRAVVYQHIKSNNIIVDLVGKGKMQMIDWSVYSDHVFDEPKWSAKKLKEKWQKEQQEQKDK